MKKSMSRMLAIVLAIIMASSLSLSAFAAPEDANGWLEVPSLKDTYKSRFDIGNIYAASIVDNGRDGVSTEELTNMMKYHYNVVSAENDMKPLYVAPNKGEYNFTNSDKMTNWALDNGLKVHGHTLVWHGQSPNWVNKDAAGQPLTRAEAQANMKEYIDNVAGHFAGRVVSWDVVNEVFGGGTYNPANGWQANLSTSSPWYRAYANGMDAEAGETVGDFVYDAFVFARLADPNAVLYVNDFNDHLQPKREAIPAMAKDLNARWKNDPRNTDLDRPLVEGVGMQAHYWSQEVNSLINNVKIALDNYSAAGLRIIVTELDIPASTSYSPRTATATDIANQTKMYGELFALYQQYDAIERVTFWGLKDNWSWRGGTNGDAQPLLFNKDMIAKDSFFEVINAYVAPPVPPTPASELKLTSDKAFVEQAEYFNVTASLDPNVASNAASLTFTYDTDKFEYRGFTVGDGIALLNKPEAKDGKITFMLGNTNAYDLSNLGTVLFSANDVEILEGQDSVIDVSIDYVLRDEGEKSIVTATSSIEVGTRITKEFTLLDLSDVIDLFGSKKGDANWDIAKRFDYNNNGVIDISDITQVASLIK